MKVKELNESLESIIKMGLGDLEVVIFEKLFRDEPPYHTTVENISHSYATWDNNKEVVVLLP